MSFSGCSLVVATAAGFLLLTIIFRSLSRTNASSRAKRLSFAPGPKPLPIVWNLYDMPSNSHGARYIEWGKRYNSNILHATVLGKHYVILNSFEDAEELFERCAVNYSDRPYDPIADMIGWGGNMALLSLGNIWRQHRRVAQQYFRQSSAIEYHGIQLEKVHNMLRGLLESPEEFDYHNKMLSVSIPMSMMYGHNLQSLHDPFVIAAHKNTSMAMKLLQPGFSLIGIIHCLQYIPSWLPGAVTQSMAKETKRLSNFLRNKPLEMMKMQLNENKAGRSIVARYLELKNGDVLGENLIGDLGLAIYVAASDTTISATETLIYVLATHPNIQKKAQEEIDLIIGSDRLPNFADRPSLPYIEALYRELLRWRPPAPLGIAHHAASEDVYRGYYIPKGTGVIANIWAMTHDETKYPDPYTFNPERFLDSEGKLNSDERILAYGFGRRVCVGKHVASSTMWITIVSLLAVFDIFKAKDIHGNDIDIAGEYEEVGLIARIKPFKCSITPRSKIAKRLILGSLTAED